MSKLPVPAIEKRIGIAADHGGFEMKEYLLSMLRATDYKVIDFGNYELNTSDDYPDYIIPLARELSEAKITHGIALCGSGVGVSIVANKIHGVRACLIHEKFPARQGVEDDNINMICFGGRVISNELAWELACIFLEAKFSGQERHVRRLAKITALEKK